MLADQRKGRMLGEVAEEGVCYLSPTLREGVGHGERPISPDPHELGWQGLHYRSGVTWGYDIIKVSCDSEQRRNDATRRCRSV